MIDCLCIYVYNVIKRFVVISQENVTERYYEFCTKRHHLINSSRLGFLKGCPHRQYQSDLKKELNTMCLNLLMRRGNHAKKI